MSSRTPAQPPAHEEPEITQEESVPSDGRDTEGEELMKQVNNRKLHEEGSAEDKTPDKSEQSKADKS
ncbi:hypothetical protein RT97_29195 [Variovorax paradoxus]|uniref:Uncharacterized protein n=1 Tax=Variovorax paradoxus TaxID=34073 RepID=A0A0D0LG04_VARPD|nr:hypothetical protein [Variovorax paradoxus]KIQ17669.1 hypothetical protein RT97_29195 [Variovorax paradoxus]